MSDTGGHRPAGVIQWVYSAAVREFKKQPISFLLGVAGGIGLLISAATGVLAWFSPLAFKPIDLGLVVKACGFFVLQGTLASIFCRLQAYIQKLGNGFPVIISLVVSIICCWLSAFISFWLIGPGFGQFGPVLFFAITLLAFATFAYFVVTYFDEQNVEGANVAWVVVQMVVGFFVFGIYFGYQL